MNSNVFVCNFILKTVKYNHEMFELLRVVYIFVWASLNSWDWRGVVYKHFLPADVTILFLLIGLYNRFVSADWLYVTILSLLLGYVTILSQLIGQSLYCNYNQI